LDDFAAALAAQPGQGFIARRHEQACNACFNGPMQGAIWRSGLTLHTSISKFL
jgi:hypothetical protein